MKIKKKSTVLETPAAHPEDANRFFSAKLSYETDCADVYQALRNGIDDFVIIDTRSPEAYAKSHVPGAINLPGAKINERSTADLSKDKLLVTYCWGPGCNGATKGAARLSGLGFRVKEMIGGIEYWQEREKYPVESGEVLAEI